MYSYQGLTFPARAEDLRQELYNTYRVFLEYWDPLAAKLRLQYEALALQQSSNAIVIYGGQGTGKTLLADKLAQGLTRARQQALQPYDSANMWHRLTAGTALSPELIRDATARTDILHIEDDSDWVKRATTWHDANRGRHCIILADNAERGYFLQGLLNLSDADFIRYGRTPEALSLAAEKFVSLARGKLRPSLFLFLTNNEPFASDFCARVSDTHRGLARFEALPMPSNRDKETVVRVNINRLNPVSYWYCLDRAGPSQKGTIRSAIEGNETFPGCFRAVHEAFACADRAGRAANKCTLTLVVFADCNSAPPSVAATIGPTVEKRSFAIPGLRIDVFDEGWAAAIIPDPRRASLLESEWGLRVVYLGNQFLSALLKPIFFQQRAKTALDLIQEVHGTGTHDPTLAAYKKALGEAMWQLPPAVDDDEMASFWSKGQIRSHEYEKALRSLYPRYNRGGPGFLTYRPDLIVTPYKVCSVLDTEGDDKTSANDTIKRSAHVLEFTCIRDLNSDHFLSYVQRKLLNYLDLLEQQ